MVLAAGGWAYATSFAGAFVFDDLPAIANNPNIRTLWPLTRAMSAPKDSTLAGRPAASLTFAINYALASPDTRDAFEVGPAIRADESTAATKRNAWGYHAANLAIHLAAAVALFGVVRRTLLSERLKPRFASEAGTLAFAAALLWVVHPLNTESVTYIVQRTESLMGLFALLTLYCSTRAVAGTHPRLWTVAVVACYGIAAGSKEVAVVVPLLVILWDVLFLARGGPTNAWPTPWKQRWPLYVVLSLIALFVSVTAPAARPHSAGLWLNGWTPWSYLLTQSSVVVHYLRLAIWPSPLVLDPYWPKAVSVGAVAWPIALLTLLLALTVWGALRRHPAAFIGACFFLLLAPTSSVLPIVTEVAAEHRMYLPLAAVIASVVVACHVAGRWLLLRVAPHNRYAGRSATTLGILALAIGAACLGVETRARSLDYSSDENIWRDTIKKQPWNTRARTALGADFVSAGRYEEAVEELEASLALDPGRVETLSNLGAAEVALGRTGRAIGHLERAVALRPDFIAAHRNLGAAYRQSHQDALAVRHFRCVADAEPDTVVALTDLALLLAVTSDDTVRNGAEALRFANRAVALSSRRDPAALTTLATALAELDRFNEAMAVVREAAALPSLNPALAQQLTQLAEAYSAHQKVRRPGSSGVGG